MTRVSEILSILSFGFLLAISILINFHPARAKGCIIARFVQDRSRFGARAMPQTFEFTREIDPAIEQMIATMKADDKKNSDA